MKFGVVVFPGSNCDHDTYHVVSKVIGQPVRFIWHQESVVDDCDTIILPGGFSYGDYLRCGALAQFSPVMAAVKEFAANGGFVLGICNGFQILCEARLLPGALLRNEDLRFHCEYVNLRVENAESPFTSECAPGDILSLPIAHGDGNYFCTPAELAELERDRRILLKYSTPDGKITGAANPNGSVNSIAGITNAAGNVFGLMPHPERACEETLGGGHGLRIFQSILNAMTAREKARDN